MDPPPQASPPSRLEDTFPCSAVRMRPLRITRYALNAALGYDDEVFGRMGLFWASLPLARLL